METVNEVSLSLSIQSKVSELQSKLETIESTFHDVVDELDDVHRVARSMGSRQAHDSRMPVVSDMPVPNDDCIAIKFATADEFEHCEITELPNRMALIMAHRIIDTLKSKGIEL